MVYIEKRGLTPTIEQKIIEIKKSDKWKNLDVNNTDAVRMVFNDEFPKEDVKQVLIEERHGLCAYCMRRIQNNPHSRIEHLEPLSKDKEKAIDYNNMLGVCDGGEGVSNQSERILCCDAHKKNDLISLSPLNRVQMEKIAYSKDGLIYTMPKDEQMEKDINEVLHLNGVRKADGSIRDTATEILKGRRDTYERARRMARMMEGKGKYSISNLQKVIEQLETQEQREEYVGVKLYYFKKKLKSLEMRKRSGNV